MKLLTRELIFPLEGRKTPACHASTIVRLPDGDLLAAWFGGGHEGWDDVEIWLSRRSASGWCEPWRVTEPTALPCWNPVLYNEGNRVTLWYKRGRPIAAWRTLVRVSEDGGRTWSAERELVPGDDSGGRGPVKDKPIRLRNGWLIAGASHEYLDGRWLAFADISKDGGRTWARTEYLAAQPGAGLIQPSLWESASGVHMLLRSNCGWVYRADSEDCGQHWSPAVPTVVSNNNSGLDVTAVPDGRLFLVCNPVGVKGVRTPVSLLESRDDGVTWRKCLDLESAPGEYSYPAILFVDDRLHITYTYRRESIAYCQFALD